MFTLYVPLFQKLNVCIQGKLTFLQFQTNSQVLDNLLHPPPTARHEMDLSNLPVCKPEALLMRYQLLKVISVFFQLVCMSFMCTWENVFSLPFCLFVNSFLIEKC